MFNASCAVCSLRLKELKANLSGLVQWNLSNVTDFKSAVNVSNVYFWNQAFCNVFIFEENARNIATQISILETKTFQGLKILRINYVKTHDSLSSEWQVFFRNPLCRGGPEFFSRIRTPLICIAPHLRQSATASPVEISFVRRDFARPEETACWRMRMPTASFRFRRHLSSGARARSAEGGESLIEIDNRGISCQIALIEWDLTCRRA